MSRSQKGSRRDFLRTTAASFATASLGATVAGAGAQGTEPPARKFGYAIVGIGSLALTDILPAFAQTRRSRVTGLVSGDIAKARATAAQYGVPERGLYSYDTFDRIAENPEIDAVYIVLPNNLHAEYTIRGHHAGKHVLVEKPMAHSVKDCEAMIAAGKQANRHLVVGNRLRYEPFTQAMIRMAREREFGTAKVILCESGFNIGNPEQWRLTKATAGGGSMMDVGIYSVNAARYLSGEEPAEVFGMEYTTPGDPRFKEVEETINFQMRFPSGVLANCVSSYA
ncbi:MAG: Gfo/Idh/MocA family oxidoreductase, partial [Acidobacteriota bacterium]